MEADAKTIQDIAVVRSTDTAYQVYRASYQRNVIKMIYVLIVRNKK